jgi:hypothetical protein
MTVADSRALLRDYWKAPVIAAAASLGLADHIDGDIDTRTLAHDLGVDEHSLGRLMKALAALGLLSDGGDGRFGLTEAGRPLRSDDPDSILGMARHVGGMLLPAFLQLDLCVRTGAPPPGIKHGPEGFAALIDNPREAHIFNQSMVDGSRSILDLPHARAGAELYLAGEGVADRAEFVDGSFFDPIPAGADCLLLKYIIHDWNDAYAEQIIARVGDAVRAAAGTLILIERILPDRLVEDADQCGAAASDLTMMLWGGRERTESDFAQLFAGAGLALTGTTPIGEAHYVIEAKPA